MQAGCCCPPVQQGILLASSTWCPRKHSLFFSQAALQPLGSQSVLVLEIIIFDMQDMTFFLLSFMKFWTAHLTYMTRSLWTAAQPFAVPAAYSSAVSSTNLLRVPCSRSLRKMLILVSRGMPVTDLKLHFLTVLASVWAWQFIWFSLCFYLSRTSWVCLWWCCGTQHQKPY